MKYSARILFCFVCLLSTGLSSKAQLPTSLTLQIYLEDVGVPVQGWHDLTLTWYPSIVGGSPLHEETFQTLVTDGIATVHVGSKVPLTIALMQQSPLWIGTKIDGGIELTPRMPVLTVPFAMLANRALVAERLAPEVTGVVTSVNEIAGAIELRGSNGITIQRNANELEIASRYTVESGSIPGVLGQHLYSVTPLTLLFPNSTIIATVTANTSIDVRVDSLDLLSNSILFVTSAPLLDTEFIKWQIQP